jgi:hypothetical protein
MFARIAFFLIALFWATMNVLLWRSEFGRATPSGDLVPVATVWQKILAAPDASALNIYQRGEKIGFCHWSTGMGESFSKLDEAPPLGLEGVKKELHIQLDGNVTLRDFQNRVHFKSLLKLADERTWQELKLQLSMRPTIWELHASATAKTVRLKADDGQTKFDRVLRFGDLGNPDAVLGEFSGPLSLGVFGTLGGPTAEKTPALLAGLRWEARYDMMKIGREQVRVYRLETRILDKYEVKIFVSRAGEILRVELPGEVVLMLEQLGNR